MFTARNHEFFRDRAAFGWNFAFPFLIIVGFGLIFGGKEHQQFKIGVWSAKAPIDFTGSTVPLSFQQGKDIQFINLRQSGSEGEKNCSTTRLTCCSTPSHRDTATGSTILLPRLYCGTTLPRLFSGRKDLPRKTGVSKGHRSATSIGSSPESWP